MQTRIRFEERDRSWELAYRAAELLWARVGERAAVLERRQRVFAELAAAPIGTSDRDKRQFGIASEPVCEWIAERWTAAFDEWNRGRHEHVFDDAFGAMLFARILWANEPVLLRGHVDHSWTLTTTLERARQKGDSQVRRLQAAGERFLEALTLEEHIMRPYAGKIPERHRLAILQHYGFPTDLLDVTTSYDVALYFAEGGTDHLEDDGPSLGCLYAFPAWAVPSAPYTLAPSIMRPSLQRGVFLAGLSAGHRAELDRFRLVYRHADMPVWDGLHGIPFGSPAALGRYLFPFADPLARLATTLLTSAAVPGGE